MTPETNRPDQDRLGEALHDAGPTPNRDRAPGQNADSRAPADRPAPEQPGDENLDKTRTPGDGTLDGSTPAGLTVDQLRQRAEDTEGSSEPGTG
ncbi:hypothetical protein [Azospirillum sp.]|uniref:hypothetical protein n=1 Tax=Azospirillum sp. TaxID=34012 RepID=UPI002D2DDD70|nr:hypothetical protein [Azospirillum sp.]HYD71191.1 hypothetical protein [Azospirillum sp.]